MGAASDRFGVGEDASASAFVGGVFAVPGGMVFGLAGVVVLAVTAVRRRQRAAIAHR